MTACLYFRRVRRLAITGKMDCDELIDGLLSAKGTGDEAPSERPTATTYLQNQEEPDRVQKQRERLASVAVGVKARRYRLLAHGKALTASHIEELEDSEIEVVRPLQGETRGADDKDARVCSAPALCGGGITVSHDPGRKPTGAYC